MAGSESAEVVSTSDLREILIEWRENWYKERAKVKPRSGWAKEQNKRDEQVSPVKPLEWLSHETGYSEKVFYKITGKRTEWTSLSVTDAFLTAIGHPEYLRTRLKVIPNPSWSEKRYQKYMREKARGGGS